MQTEEIVIKIKYTSKDFGAVPIIIYLGAVTYVDFSQWEYIQTLGVPEYIL